VPTVATPLPVPRYHQIYLLLRERERRANFRVAPRYRASWKLAREYRVHA